MEHHNTRRGEVSLSIRKQHNKDAYFADFKWANGSIGVRWDFDHHGEAQHKKEINSAEDIRALVDESFGYCNQVIEFLKEE